MILQLYSSQVHPISVSCLNPCDLTNKTLSMEEVWERTGKGDMSMKLREYLREQGMSNHSFCK